jgi:hypothetical protein
VGAGLCAVAAVLTLVYLPRGTEPRRIRLRVPAVAVAIVAAFVAVDIAFAGAPGKPIGAYRTAGAYTFESAPALHPPIVQVTTRVEDGSLAPGYLMLANFYDLTRPPLVGQSGPLLLDSRLQPVWFRPVPTNVVAGNLEAQTYDGQPVLTWWQGVLSNTGATESGEVVVVDRHYRTVARLHGAAGWIITLHELVIHGHDAWVTANKNIPMNLTKYGGANNGALVDSAVQEYDLRTGRLLYTWDARDHIPLSDSHTLAPANGFPWDAYHVNAISLEPGGRFLVSMRDTWAAYEVAASTGRILWTLGGKHSTFSFGPGAAFQWQHDVVQQPNGRITLFDDACCQITGAGTYLAPDGPSRGLELALDRATRRATVVKSYAHGGFAAAYMGSMQPLANGNVVVGWGALPFVSEYARSGKLLLDGVLPAPDLSYRARLGRWVGLPSQPPALAVRTSGGRTTVYASWNGATQLAAWQVLAGPSATHLAVVASALRAGFETAVPVTGQHAVYVVEALDADGKVIGRSRPAS